MNQNNNPWLSLVALLLAVLIVVLNCTGCTRAKAATPSRFFIEYGGDHNGLYAWVVTDTANGQEYLFCKDGDASGLCKLED